MQAKMRQLRSHWDRISSKHTFMIGALVLAIALIFGAPLLAQNEKPAVALQEHGEAGHGDSEETAVHGEEAEHGEASGPTHPPTLVDIAANTLEGKNLHSDPTHAHHPVAKFLLEFKAPIYSAIVIGILCAIFIPISRRLTLIPGRYQNLVEWAIEGLDNFVQGVLGPDGRRFVPFLGTLFIYIYLQNILGLFPLMFTPTAVVNTTLAMSLIVFVTVQIVAVRSHGPLGYLWHLAGEPRDVVGWAMSPLMLPLHIVGEVAKPISLALRLFGNMMGGESLLAVFMGLGVAILAFTNMPFGFPLHFPFLFLELLVTLVQALVFTLLSTIYISLVLPHSEEAH
jgi:F-type H+-transporting ATPase subunit a